MATYFALVCASVVTKVIVADQAFIDEHPASAGCSYVQTYPDGSNKKNFASPGFIYRQDKDAFIPKKPHESWVLDEQKLEWKSPVPEPKDGKRYHWDEANKVWKQEK